MSNYEKGKWYIDHGYSYFGKTKRKKDADIMAKLLGTLVFWAYAIVYEHGLYSIYAKRVK